MRRSASSFDIKTLMFEMRVMRKAHAALLHEIGFTLRLKSSPVFNWTSQNNESKKDSFSTVPF